MSNTRGSLPARDRRARRDVAKGMRTLPGKRVIVRVAPLLEALFDPDVGHDVAALVDLCAATARGEGKRHVRTQKSGQPETFESAPARCG